MSRHVALVPTAVWLVLALGLAFWQPIRPDEADTAQLAVQQLHDQSPAFSEALHLRQWENLLPILGCLGMAAVTLLFGSRISVTGESSEA